MSRGKWVQPQDVVIVDRVPITTQAQLEGWYEGWNILNTILTRLEEQEAAQVVEKQEQTQS